MRAAQMRERGDGAGRPPGTRGDGFPARAAAYLPIRLLRRICATPDRAVTVPGVLLYTDIVGSSALTERFAAQGGEGVERLSELLNDYFAHLFTVVEEHGGEIVRLEGDATFALWVDEPEGSDDALIGAAAAAMELRSAAVVDGGTDLPATTHRLALSAGPVHASVHEMEDARGFLVLRGGAFDSLGGALAHGPGGEILLSETVGRRLQTIARIEQHGGELRLRSVPARLGTGRAGDHGAPAGGDIAEITPKLVSEAVSARLASGLTGWITEFRQLSVVQVCLSEGPEAADLDLRRALVEVERALKPLRIGVWELSFGDKGAVLTVVVGLPPFAREHGARWAAEAARRIREVLRQAGIAAAIGVSTGDALYGEVGNSSRKAEYLTGAVMMRATRMMQAAGSVILCDGETAELCASDYRFEECRMIAVKPNEPPIPAHGLIGVGARDVAAHHAQAVGRAAELARIEAFLSDQRDTVSPILVIEGEPGVGKSHVLAAAAAAAERAGARVYQAVANPIEASTPYFLFRQLLPWLVGAVPGSPAGEVRASLRQILGDHPLGQSSPALDAIVSIGWTAERSVQLGADAYASTVEEVVVQAALAKAGTSRLVIAVDDVQWLDVASGKLLNAIAERVPACRILAASRPPEGDPSAPVTLAERAERMRLGNLGGTEITEIVCQLLGVRELPNRLRQLLAERTEGIPLYAEQLVFALRQGGMLEVVNGRCWLKADDIAVTGQPRSIRELIAMRLDLLPRLQQVVLKAASAIGPEIPVDLLAAICPVPLRRQELAACGGELASAGFLAGLDGVGRIWTFRHRVVCDAVYGALPPLQRRPLHSAIAEWLRQTNAHDLSPVFGELAEHYEGAGDLDSAIDFGIRAAERALDRFANADALSRLGRVRALIEKRGAGVDERRVARAALLSGQACHRLSRFADADRHYQMYARLSGIALPRGTRSILQRVPLEIAEQALRRAQLLGPAAADEAGERALITSRIFTAFAEQAFFDNDRLRLFFYCMAALNRAERACDDRETAIGFGAITIGLGGAGLHRLARFYREKSIAAAERSGDPASMGFTYLLGTVYSTAAGDWSAVERCGEAGYAASMRAGDRHRAQSCRLLLAVSAIWRGRFAQAGRDLREFGADAEAVRNLPVRAWVRVVQVLFDLCVGGTDERAMERLGIAEDPELPRAERLMCRGLRAGILLRRGRRARARAEAAEVLSGMRGSPVTLGISLDGITAVALVHLDAPAGKGLVPGAELDAAVEAVSVAARFSRQNLVGRPRALLLEGRLAAVRGDTRRAVRRYRQAAQEAERRAMPLDEAAALVALGAAAGDETYMDSGRALMNRAGARPWFLDQLVPEAAGTGRG